MNTLILYDSKFGNTKQIAEAIGSSLNPQDHIEICHVNGVKPNHLKGVEFLIVGSPTQKFKPTKAIVDFINGIPANGLNGIKVAAFDTRISIKDVNSRLLNLFVKIFGFAAEPMAKLLKRKGGNLVVPPAGFIVTDTEGPLKDGELERVSAWIKS